jgi:hypothetical protein
MARPKPHILLEYINPKTYKAEQILAADYIYAVFYKGKPINLRTLNHLISYPGPKYKKTSHCNGGHAFNLAERLNKLFKCSDFTVYKLSEGVPVTEINNEDEIID